MSRASFTEILLLSVLLLVLNGQESTAFVTTTGTTTRSTTTSSRTIQQEQRSFIRTSSTTATQLAAKTNKKPPTAPAVRPANEFSRTYRVESVLSGGHRQRDYHAKVEATEEELTQLAQRFELNQIYSLEAELDLRRERMTTSSTSPGVEVEGTVHARVDQVCVRTGEIFDVDVQFQLFAIVRPIAVVGSAGSASGMDVAGAAPVEEEEVPQEVLDYEERVSKSNNKKDKDKRKKRDTRVKTPNLKDMDVMELQKLLQDFDVEDDVMEDEGIYGGDGMLDVGELVAQLFWLKLDPYPKKPGSSPVSSSITG